MSSYCRVRPLVIVLVLLVGCQTPADNDGDDSENSLPEAAVEEPFDDDDEGTGDESPEIDPEVGKQGDGAGDEAGSDEKTAGEETAPGCEAIDEDRFGYFEGEFDLNENGLSDKIYEDLEHCGPRTCLAAILKACEGGGYRVVAQIGYFQGIEPTEETTKGWRNLEVTKAGRDSDDRIDTSVETYVWDGETYVRSR